ncbi:MAG: hydrogenase maturation protease [Chloroflexi bacterium]|nr:hydrogenase maturation protease [Chloroflexota bacterium]MCL5274279.1 hydrogenase maturation protease [Chloroflexota bacterium]
MRTLIVGLGNPILSDDGIGIRVAQAVHERIGAAEAEFLEASQGGLRLAEQLEGYDRVILIDAIQTRGGVPGAIYRLTLEDMPSYNTDGAHDASLKNALQLIRQQGGRTPDADAVAIIAIEAVNMLDFGETLTPQVEAAIPAAVQAVLGTLEAILLQGRWRPAHCERHTEFQHICGEGQEQST